MDFPARKRRRADALTRLGALRRDIIETNIASHSGRLFKVVGDGLSAEFASAVATRGTEKTFPNGTGGHGCSKLKQETSDPRRKVGSDTTEGKT